METRSRENVMDFGEVFTPEKTVGEMLDLIPDHVWADPEYHFLEPTCGNGNFVVEIFKRRLQHGIPVLTALETLVGLDISLKNVNETKKRILTIIRDGLDEPK